MSEINATGRRALGGLASMGWLFVSESCLFGNYWEECGARPAASRDIGGEPLD